MKLNGLKTSFWLSIAAMSVVPGALLMSCSNAGQNQAQTPSPTATTLGDKPDSTHGSMGDMKSGGMMMHTMNLGPADSDYDLRFIDGMIPHHEGAVVMAKEVLKKSQRSDLKKFAENIITAQAKEIAEMKRWRSAWYPKAPSTPMAWHSSMGHMMAMSADQKNSMMMSMDLGQADSQFDLRFVTAMIPHHEGAIAMAKDALNKSQRPEIKKLAQDIITSQAAEIKQMKQWKQAW